MEKTPLTDDTVLVEQSACRRRWVLKTSSALIGTGLAQRLQVSLFLGRLLASYGLTVDTAADFLHPTLRSLMPDPFHLHDMDKACGQIADLIESGDPIGLFGDYDVDGATSTALFTLYIQSLGGCVHFHIPDRIDEGYGPNLPAFLGLKEKGCTTIVTLDCGTTAFDPLDGAAAHGIQVIVVDHHKAEARLPKALAVVNPNRLDQDSPLCHLAAVGVSFMVIAGVQRTLKDRGFFDRRGITPPDLRLFLDLVALGTVCDVVPLLGLNRAFVRQGLKVMASRRHVGLRALSDVCAFTEPPGSYHLGFLLGPRINAGGRVGAASTGARLLTATDPTIAQGLALQLDQWNQERRAIEQGVLDDVMAMAAAEHAAGVPFLCLAGEGWHPGVIGIVAGRVKEHYHKPCFIIAIQKDGQGKGSGRSIMGVDLGAWTLDAKHRGLLTAGGGHQMAAGLSVHQDQIPALRAFFLDKMTHLALDLTPHLTISGILPLESLTPDFTHHLDQLGPFGQGNPTPRFVFTHVRIVSVMAVGGGDHLRVHLKSLGGTTAQAMAFRVTNTPMGDLLRRPRIRDHVYAVVGAIKLNKWMGRETVQIILEDMAPQQDLNGELLIAS